EAAKGALTKPSSLTRIPVAWRLLVGPRMYDTLSLGLARTIVRHTASGEIILRLIDDYDWFAGFGRAWAQGALAVSSTKAISLVKATTESGATVLAIARLLDHRG